MYWYGTYGSALAPFFLPLSYYFLALVVLINITLFFFIYFSIFLLLCFHHRCNHYRVYISVIGTEVFQINCP